MKKVEPKGMRPPCAAMPLTMAHMPNSRTPKKTLRPVGSTWKLGESLKMVLVEAVRSAAPPKSSGTTFSMAFMNDLACVAGRDRLVGWEDGDLLLPSVGELRRVMTRSNSAAGSG